VRAPAVLIGREPQAQPVHLDLTPSGFVARLPAAGPTTPLPRVQDAVAASDGSLYVLDGGRGVVYEFDRRGAVERTLGGPGRGDGQMLYPIALAMDERGELYVLDLGNQRVATFDLAQARPAFSAFGVRRASSGLCLADSAVITFGAAGDSLLRVIDVHGGVRSTIGTPYSQSEMVELTLAYGYLTCARDGDEVVVLPSALRELRTYRIGSGRLLWEVSLPGYRPQMITQSGNQVTITAPPGGFDEARGIHLIRSDIVVVQVSFRKPRTEAPDAGEQLTTYYYRLSDGQYLGRETDLPRLVAVADTIAFFADKTDSVTIRGFRYRVTGGPR